MIQHIHNQLAALVRAAGVTGDISFSTPPKTDMGQFAFACFAYAKELEKNPAETASTLVEEITRNNTQETIVSEVKAFGPYVNFFLNPAKVAALVLSGIAADETYGSLDMGAGKQVMVEFACPNPMKAFHLGHLKNLITGESVVRLLENAGYDVIRANYQGDVGRHIGMSVWGLLDWKEQYEAVKSEPLTKRVEFLGKAYAHGAQSFEASEELQQDIRAVNTKVYARDPELLDIYTEARQWSLDYFDTIYKKMGSRFDKMYFESQTFARGIEMVNQAVADGVFVESNGAVIFEGSKHDLHDRVFLNGQGHPTYEGKDLALTEIRFAEYPNLDEVIHVVGKEQGEYFKVVFEAIKAIGMPGAGKESHIPGGFLQLKGDQKMSSRTGNVITGDALISLVQEKISEVMKDTDIADKDVVIKKVTAAALKYAMLKVDITKDVAFDLEESISTSGNSGPYLLYIVARINSIIKKIDATIASVADIAWNTLEPNAEEQALVLALAQYPQVTTKASAERETSLIAKYLFDLAQTFNSFYHTSSIQDATGDSQQFRLHLVRETRRIMTHGLYILGIETVDEM